MGRTYCGCGRVGDHVCDVLSDAELYWIRRCPECDVLVSPDGRAATTCRNGHDFLTESAMALTQCEGCEGHPNALPGVRWPTASNSDPRHQWIERCDLCEEYESDEDAADALVRYGRIPGWRWATPVGSASRQPFSVIDEIVGLPERPPVRIARGAEHIASAADRHAARMADAESGDYDPDAIFAAEDEAPTGADPHIDALRSQGLA